MRHGPNEEALGNLGLGGGSRAWLLPLPMPSLLPATVQGPLPPASLSPQARSQAHAAGTTQTREKKQRWKGPACSRDSCLQPRQQSAAPAGGQTSLPCCSSRASSLQSPATATESRRVGGCRRAGSCAGVASHLGTWGMPGPLREWQVRPGTAHATCRQLYYLLLLPCAGRVKGRCDQAQRTRHGDASPSVQGMSRGCACQPSFMPTRSY